MNPAIYVAMFMPFLVLLIISMSRRRIIATIVTKRKKKLERATMQEMAKRFIGKECIIYSYDGNQVSGVIKEISSGAALVERNETLEAINLDFVSRIREYPKGKNGKKNPLCLIEKTTILLLNYIVLHKITTIILLIKNPCDLFIAGIFRCSLFVVVLSFY